MKLLRMTVLVVLALGLVSCGQGRPNTEASPLETASPEKTSLPTSPLATPDSSLEVPTPSPGLAVVTGRLVAVSPAASPFLAGDIYLAPVIQSEGATPMPFIRLEPDEDPKATLRTEEEEFAIVNVAPGEYGLIVHTPVSDYLVMDNGEPLIVEVKEDEIINLGDVEIG